MEKCKCGNKTILMTSYQEFIPDSEPYENGKEESVNLTINGMVYLHYCEECENVVRIWADLD